MGLQKNELGLYVPVREDRRTDSSAPLGSATGFVEHSLNGDVSAIVALNIAGILTGTIEIALSADDVNFDAAIFYVQMGVLGTLPVFSQALIGEAFTNAAVGTRRVYALQTSGMRKLRVRYSAWTTGNADVFISSSSNESIHPNVIQNKASTLMVSNLTGVGIVNTLTLPAVAGLRHYIDFIQVTRVASLALVAGAGTTSIATTNLPGTAASQLIFGQNAAPQGDMLEKKLDFGSTGLAALAIGAATTIVMPATTGVIWHGVCAYRLGL
jgi:hypothetical protein